jgi:hypothetical protein
VSQDIGPFKLWRLLVAVTTTAMVFAGVWLVIQYFLGAFEPPVRMQDRTPKSPAGIQMPVK